ncbi:unnamed protein product [Nezara viridula]|uniref:Protein inscuteable homologue C-terminal domain-containing protein n=1 Tax=Nezara viridula TaxID=85310 RepID=A0A9P0GZQ6_NEZVI|nr:unnamed protein product [Nezara viridula]
MNIEKASTPQPSLSETSHKSQDSGFSDSEGHGTVLANYCGAKRCDDSDNRSSCDDLSTLPPPAHSSTPKTKEHMIKRCQMEERIYCSREWNSPVKLWLSEVRYLCDPECTSSLQSKPITAGTNENVTRTTSYVVNTIRSLHRQLSSVCSKLNLLYRKINKGNLKGSGRQFERITQRMVNILSEHNEKYTEDFDCSGLQIAFSTLNSREKDVPNLKSIMKTVALLFSKKVEQILLNYIKMLIDLLKNEKSPSSLAIILSGIGSLGLHVSHLADLMAYCSGISHLLSVFVNCSSPAVHTAALNILSTICCTPDSVRQFENSGGVELLSDILTDTTKGEAEYCGAVSLLVQVTAPWLEITVQNMEKQLEPLIASITRLISQSQSSEMLLLCAAALANISCIEPKSIWPLVYCSSTGTLLKAVRILGPKASIFLKEQAVTLLANMSGVKEILPHLTQNRAVPALLCFLQVSLSPLQSSAEKDATFRVQHKAVIALSRLCNDSEAAMQVAELQGVSRLVRLCKEENERNNNDSVLACCLVTLRKITKHCGLDAVKSLNASELVEPELFESILLYSSKCFEMK